MSEIISFEDASSRIINEVIKLNDVITDYYNNIVTSTDPDSVVKCADNIYYARIVEIRMLRHHIDGLLSYLEELLMNICYDHHLPIEKHRLIIQEEFDARLSSIAEITELNRKARADQFRGYMT